MSTPLKKENSLGGHSSKHHKHTGDYVAAAAHHAVEAVGHLSHELGASAADATRTLQKKLSDHAMHLRTQRDITEETKKNRLETLKEKFSIVEDFRCVSHIKEASDILVLLFQEKRSEDAMFAFLHSDPVWQIDPFELVKQYGVFADAFCSSPDVTNAISLCSSQVKEKSSYIKTQLMGQEESMTSLSYISLDTVNTELERQETPKPVLFTNIDNMLTELRQKLENRVHCKEHSLRPNALVVLEKLRIQLESAIDMTVVEVHSLPKDIAGSIFCKSFAGKSVMCMHSDSLACVDKECAHMMDEFNERCATLEDALQLCKDTVKELFQLLHRQFFGDNVAAVALVDRLEYISVLLRKVVHPKMHVSVCGEQNCGKTTFLAALMGENCLPTAADPNSCMPVRVLADSSVVEPYMIVPTALVMSLNAAAQDIINVTRKLTAAGYSSDVYDENDFPKECREFYDHMRSMDVFTETRCDFFTRKVIGARNIRDSIDLMNKLVALVYALKQSPRFAHRLAYVRPLHVLLSAGRQIMDTLPSVYVRCAPTEHIPFLGKLAFIDTPGLTKVGGRDSFFHDVNKVMDRIFAQSHRVLLLTTPKYVGSDFFTNLHQRLTKNFPHRLMIVINKFEFQGVSSDQLPLILNNYRNTLTKVSKSITDADTSSSKLKTQDIQWLRAKEFHDIEWCKIELARKGGFDKVASTLEGLHDLTGPTRLTLKRLFGNDWEEKHLALDIVRKPGDRKKWIDFSNKAKFMQFDSNFRNILGLCILPIFSRMAVLPVKKVITHNTSLLQNVLVKLMARYALAKKASASQQLLVMLSSAADGIDQFVKSIDGEIKKELSSAMQKAFHAQIMKSLAVMKHEAAIRLQSLEDSCTSKEEKETVQTIQYNVYADIPDVGDVEMFTRSVNQGTHIVFNTEVEADEFESKALTAVEETLAASNVEKLLEQARTKAFREAVDKSCYGLLELVQSTWRTNPISLDSAAAQESVEIYADLKEALLEEISNAVTTTTLKVCALPAARLHAEIEHVDELATKAFWEKEKHHVWIKIYNDVFQSFLTNYYMTPAYMSYQIGRGAEAEEKSLHFLTHKLKDVRMGIQNVIEVVEASVSNHDDSLELSKSMTELRSLVKRHKDLGAVLDAAELRLDF